MLCSVKIDNWNAVAAKGHLLKTKGHLAQLHLEAKAVPWCGQESWSVKKERTKHQRGHENCELVNAIICVYMYILIIINVIISIISIIIIIIIYISHTAYIYIS